MFLQCIQINDLLVEESRFSLSGVLFGRDSRETGLDRSFEEFGVLTPVTVFRDDEDRYHLIDGFKRIRFARNADIPAIEAVVLPGTTLTEEIVAMILYHRWAIIRESVINKVQFVSFAVASGSSDEWIIQYLCMPLELKPHRSFLAECERVHGLPQEVKRFCHEKRFSLKQVLNLTYYPEDLLRQLMLWRPKLKFSASALDEIASNLKDYLRSVQGGMYDFIAEPEVKNIIESDLSPRERTQKIRAFVSRKRFPVLTDVNENIERVVHDLALPEEITVAWDRTLENRSVEIVVKVKDGKQWQGIAEKLGSYDIEAALRNILDKL